LGYDGEAVTYRCKETGKEETVPVSGAHMKLAWKTDWGMRWAHLGVNFESAGKDHLSPGGSYDASARIVADVFGGVAPVSLAYEFIGIQGLGAKMSGSKGNSVTPGQLLEIYEGPMLLWLYFRKFPWQRFDLSFGSEIVRQYAEFDSAVAKLRSEALGDNDAEALLLAGAAHVSDNPIPFRHAVAYGQIVQWDLEKMMELLSGLELAYDRVSVESRLAKARAWLETYNSEEMVALLDGFDAQYFEDMSEERRARVVRLREMLFGGMSEIGEIERNMYEIPKVDGASDNENKQAQREFFTDVYRLLIGRDTGPRLSTFLWALDGDKVGELLGGGR